MQAAGAAGRRAVVAPAPARRLPGAHRLRGGRHEEHGRPGQAGTISAALLLQEFVGDVPWAHLDIAGPSRTDDNRWYLTKGGTGFGVRTLVALVTSEAFARWLATRPKDYRASTHRARP